MLDDVAGQLPWILAGADALGHGDQRPSGIALAEALDDLVDGDGLLVDAAGRRDLVEGRQCVGHGAVAASCDKIDGIGRHLEAGVGRHPAQVFGK